ncbi:Vacuolar cation/proton exchanger 3 [Wickerhamomyces ciferrii]|uniref:Vacuolar cation/proton exchanger 3 n=1 Tax=Wickerhamomyces ciferrii (strain ATCC 14091 / BCRC 22168 / CBS 111 / JCM 3599 / NBRC 0793 / NRRL Y-1031 F-60-10) TaxID=1206466 RepID=K0KEV5_WICCF|nr:Vacuolar cation/proton exchanger 3 [Wickerhamomyces ciferrii]CCH41476.1 Vacuolar cation/proton exchanger 3 [Wickerhamomyces ciferrii]
MELNIPNNPPERSHTFASPNDLITNDEFEKQSMNRVPSAATEPIPRINQSNSNNISREDAEVEDLKKRKLTRRVQTAPGKYNNKITIPERLIEKKPTIKPEASFFFTVVQYFDTLKDQALDKTFERSDRFYNWFWNISFIKWMCIKYRQWEQIKIIGPILQILRVALDTRTVIFLPFFPVGIVFYKREDDILAVVFLFLALMYFAKVLSNTTEIAAEHFGPVLGSLLNATFGNLVELIISGTTVSKEDATLTITSLIGSVISNNLFVTGSCCFFGGMEGKPLYNKKSITSHLLFFVCITVLLTMMSVVNDIDKDVSDKFKMDTSQVGAAFIFINYIVYLTMNTNEEFKYLKIKKARDEEERLMNPSSDSESDDDDDNDTSSSSSSESSEELPSKLVCFGALALSIAGLGPCANFFVESLKDLTDGKPISKVFIGLIILPLAGSLPEHISSVISAQKGKLDLALNLSIGSSNQVIGFVLPIIQFISSHYPQTKFTLYFEDYIAAYLFGTALISSLCIVNGMIYGINVYHGVICITTFVFIIYLTFANDQH